MSDCRQTAERMTRYVDGALPPHERSTIDGHLDHCEPCRRAVEEARGGQRVLRQALDQLPPPPLPPGLRTRCEALAREHGSRGPARAWAARLLPAMAIALLVLATTLAVFALATRRSNVVLAQQLTMDHMKCFLFPPGESHGLDAHAVEDRLAAEYGWDVHVPPASAAAGLTLVGARRCAYAFGTIPHVMYRMEGEDLSLFVLDGEQRAPADLRTLGYRSKIWSNGDHTFVLVSPGRADALDRAAHYIMEQERSR